MVARRAVDVPFWDEWEWTDLIYKMHVGTLAFSDVWAQHSEHRMLFPNLIMLGLARFGGWHPVREQFFSLALLVASQAMVVAVMQRSARSTFATFGALAATLLLFGTWQWENFNWGFQTAWFLCDAAAIAVVALLAQPKRRPMHVVLAVVVALVGSYSSSQGLVIWAVGAVALVLTGRRGYALLGIWLPIAAIAFAVYRHGMFAVDTGHLNIIGHPLLAARYILVYLGSPLGRTLGAMWSGIAGLIAICALAASFTLDFRSPYRKYRFGRNASWYALAVFSLLCALATSIGRAGFGIDQGLASRYTTISGLLWVALVGLAVNYFGRSPMLARPQYERLVLAAMAFGFIVGANDIAASLEWKGAQAVLVTARAQLISSDPAALPKLYPDPQREILLLGELRSVRDGLFGL